MYDYNYDVAMYNDIERYISYEVDFSKYESREACEEDLYDTLFVEDSVTGNASGSYWFSTYKAEEALCHNMDLLAEALEEFGCDYSYLKKGAEACDVTIRCYLLPSVLADVLDEYEISGIFEREESEE